MALWIAIVPAAAALAAPAGVPPEAAAHVAAMQGPAQDGRHLEVVPSSAGRAGEWPPPPAGRALSPPFPPHALPVAFLPNVLLEDGEIEFVAQTGAGPVLLSRDGALLVGPPGKPGGAAEALGLHLLGASPEAELAGAEPLEARANFFIGNEPSRWRTDVPIFGAVLSRDVYPGIDLLYAGADEGRMKREFRVRPGARPESIELLYSGMDSLRLEPDGSLAVGSSWTTLREAAPRCYQEERGGRADVPCAYVLRGEGRVSFEIGPFDRERELVIDPEIVFSTYLGSKSVEYGEGVAVDKSGAIYVVGAGTSQFPTTPGSYKPGSPWKLGIFLAKLDAAGKKLVWATFIAGQTSVSEPRALAVDGAGNVVITGYANNLDPTQADFPIYPPYKAFDSSFGGNFDAVVVKVSAAGNALIYSTYLGGSGQDFAYDVALDAQDNAYVVGGTGSAKFPKTAGAHQPALKGVIDAFVSKFDPNGKLLYSTLLGGSSGERALGVRAGGGGAVFVTGWTKSKDFPTKGGWSSQLAGGADVFVSKLQPGAAKPLLYSTLLGGKSDDYGHGIGIDSTQNAYVTGMTFSKDFPQKNSVGKFSGGKCPSGWKGACPVEADAFVSGLDASGGTLRYSTFLGGGGFDTARGIAVSQGGRVYATGWTGSSNFPVKDPFQAKLAGPSDAWFALLTPKGDLELSTLHGGSGWEYGLDVAIDSLGHAMVTGTSKSSDLPVKNAYDPSFNHASATGDFHDADAFLLKLKLHQVISQPKGFFDWISSVWSQLLGWLRSFFEVD